ncbi:RDD family protein [Arthrobacter sp. NPDC090010]|uniref:RDD family protein n=1 Tax=Arthrobacter sp. NPDC090010 TaxID=3363942 RepID=UPI0037FF25E1
MSIEAERCPQCQQQLNPGASFCLSCGTSLSNRAALRQGADPSQQAPAATASWQSTRPGTVAQHPDQRPEQQAVVRAGAVKRLFAKVIDAAIPGIILGVLASVGLAALLRNGLPGATNLGPSQEDVVFAIIVMGVGVLLALIYVISQWIWEARRGNSVGNALFGIRTTELEGYAPGAGAVFLRWLVLVAPNVLFTVLGVILGFFAPLGVTQLVSSIGSFISFAWFVVVGLSNGWDPQDRRQGWHDKAARTLVFDVRAGRNPVTTQGLNGAHSYPTMDLPAVRPVASPLAVPPGGLQQPVAPQQTAGPGTQAAPAPSAVPPVPQAPYPVAQPAQQQFGGPAQQMPFQPAPFQPQAFQPAAEPFAPPQASGDNGETLLRSHLPAGGASAGGVVLHFDDGGQVPLNGGVLIGRNPSGRAGEEQLLLLALEDPGRSISKTHLLVLPATGGAWVTDRQSTNGSGELLSDGSVVRLIPGEARFVRTGSSVKFGDRTFRLSTP